MALSSKRRHIHIGSHTIDLRRTEGGVAELWAADEHGLAAGLGWVHAEDRLVQMAMLRLVGQGRLGECLKADQSTLGIDIFMREMGFDRDAVSDTVNLDSATLATAEAYTSGVNLWLEQHRRPVELLLVGYRPEPWRVSDLLMTIKLMSYIGLAQSQQDMEKALIQAIHAGVSVEALQAIFTPHLDELDDATIQLIRKLHFIAPLVPAEVRFAPVPRIMASNNWVLAGSRTASGDPILCGDPHLEVNRLPAIWYEAVLHAPDDDRVGITMPGVPGLIMGRTRALAFTFTYGFMDMVDYAIEEVHGDFVRRGGGDVPIATRQETILRKGQEPLTITIRETDHGVLECDPRQTALENGLYLARAWSADHHGAAASLKAIIDLPGATNAAAAADIISRVTISCNWLLADRDGGIAYQQSGLLPKRRHSGLYPVPAWSAEPMWQGLIPADQLLRRLDPPEGILVTANGLHNPDSGLLVVNLPMGPYREKRIHSLLENAEVLDVEVMKKFQLDLHSTQADLFMPLIEPHLPATPAGRLLEQWDHRYDPESQGATLFERVYHALLERVFGEGLFGVDVWRTMVNETALHADYYWHFDRALLEDPAWFAPDGRAAVISEVVAATLQDVDISSLESWGEHQRVTMTNIFFNGTLPSWLGFDHGPIDLPGGRATVVQGGVFRSHDRQTTFCPSWRMVCDLGTNEIWTVLAGGPSGRRFSKFYLTDIADWLAGRYKRMSLGDEVGG